MYYQEIKPGVFLSNEQRIHFKLERCPYCGMVDVLSHHKYTERCIDCGNVFNLYSVRRTKRLTGQLTAKAARTHLSLLLDMRGLLDRGYKVPSTFTEELAETQKLVDTLDNMEQANRTQYCKPEKVSCHYCGAETLAPSGKPGSVRCDKCETVYKQYRALCGRIETLDHDGCDRLAKMIHSYIEAGRQGFRTPNLSRVIHKLQNRVVELGGERQIFYCKKEDSN